MPLLAGTAPNQTPTNADLGGMAFQSPEGVVIRPQIGAAPKQPGELVCARISNTQVAWKYMGDDGVVRTNTQTFA